MAIVAYFKNATVFQLHTSNLRLSKRQQVGKAPIMQDVARFDFYLSLEYNVIPMWRS